MSHAATTMTNKGRRDPREAYRQAIRLHGFGGWIDALNGALDGAI